MEALYVARFLLLATLCVGTSATASDTRRRKLTQSGATSSATTLSTTLYSPTADEGLTIVSNYSLTVRRSGVAAPNLRNANSSGFTILLEYGDVVRSSVFQNVGCMEVSLQTNSSNIASFITSYPDYIAMFRGNAANLAAAQVVGASNLSRANPGPVRALTEATNQYVVVFYSLDVRLQRVTGQVTAYPPNAAACDGVPASAPATLTIRVDNRVSSSMPGLGSSVFAPATSTAAGAAASPQGSLGVATAPTSANTGRRRLQQTPGRYSSAPGPAAQSLVQTVQVVRKAATTSQVVALWPAAFTNASCIAFRLLGQPPVVAARSRIDLSIFILDVDNLLRWAAQDFDVGASRISAMAACYQNNTAPGNCGAFVDNLDPNATYFLWGVTGLQRQREPPGAVLLNLAFTAQASGSCGNNAVQNFQDSSDYGQNAALDDDYSDDYTSDYDYDYDYDSPTPAGSSSSGSPGSFNLGPRSTPPLPPPPPRSSGSGQSNSSAPSNGINLRGSATEGTGTTLFPLPGR